MPFKSRSHKRLTEKRRDRARPISPTTPSRAAPAVEPVAPPATVKPETSRVRPSETPQPRYDYVGRELRRIAVVTAVVLAILVILYVLLR